MSLKGFFINEHHADPVIPHEPKAGGMTSGQPMTAPRPPSQSVNVDATSVDEFNQYFRDVMDKANLPGPDYYEFAKALESMKNSGLPEQQKFVAVFAGFAAQGLTADKLVDAANQYVKILNDKKVSEFDASVIGAQNLIDSKKALAKGLLDKNVELSKQMQENSAKIDSTTQEVTDLQAKLESKKTTFVMSFNNFIAKIQEDVERIKNYLQNGNTSK